MLSRPVRSNVALLDDRPVGVGVSITVVFFFCPVYDGYAYRAYPAQRIYNVCNPRKLTA